MGMGFQFEQHTLGLWDLSWDLKKAISWEMGLGPPFHDPLLTRAILFFFGFAEVNSTWLITSELANQRARKLLFTCVVYTNSAYLKGFSK